LQCLELARTQATTLIEIHELTEVVDLAGMDVVEAEAGWISAASSQIEKSAQEMLALSMLSLNQTSW
jgi:hypothetical protein